MGAGPSGAAPGSVALAIHVAQGVLQEVPAGLQQRLPVTLGIQFNQFAFDGWQQYALILAESSYPVARGQFQRVTQVGTA